LKQTYDQIVLGTGVAGLCSALALARRGQRVLLLGRKGIRGGSSPAAAGILDPLLEMKPGNPLLKLTLRAFSDYPSFVRGLKKLTGQNADYRRTGLLYVARSARESAILEKQYRWQSQMGFPVRRFTREMILKKYPTMTPDVCFGIYYPTLSKINPAKLVKILERVAKQAGVKLLRLSKDSRLVLNRGSVAGVRAGKDFFESTTVINATGSWSGVNRRLAVRAPIVPIRGQILILKGKEKIRTILHSLDGTYIVPWDPGTFLVGSTVEQVGFKSHATHAGLNDIRRRAVQLSPCVARWRRVTSWAGLRPRSKDYLPLIGPTSVKGLYFATGYYRSGILIAPLAGKLLAKGILSGKIPSILKSFSPNR